MKLFKMSHLKTSEVNTDTQGKSITQIFADIKIYPVLYGKQFSRDGEGQD